MLDQLFEGFRKASESSLKAHQDVLRQWTQLWPSATPQVPGLSVEWGEMARKRLRESTTEALSTQRELFDSMYKSGLQLLQQGFRVANAKSPEDYGRLLGELSSKMSESFKEQSEAQVRGLQKTVETWSEVQFKIKF